LKKLLAVQSYFFYAGSDPTRLVEEEAKNAKKNLNRVSIRQGIKDFAEVYSAQSKAKEKYVLLQS
jgi:hypothetical protein